MNPAQSDRLSDALGNLINGMEDVTSSAVMIRRGKHYTAAQDLTVTLSLVATLRAHAVALEELVTALSPAKPIVPSWAYKFSAYDGLEVSPCRDTADEDERRIGTCYEQCTREQAEIWSVYGHIPEGGVECLEDFTDEASALSFARHAVLHNPCLQKHGVQEIA
jgi:hypothetical protein